MNRNLSLVALLLLTACKKQEEVAKHGDLPVKTVVNGMDMLEYQEPGGAFQADAPASWKLRETNNLGPEVTFIGPGTPGRPFSSDINISRYPNPVDKSGDPKRYYDGFSMIDKVTLPYGKRKLGGREVECYALERPFRKLHSKKVEYHRRDDFAVIRIPDGFFLITHSAPVEDYKATFPIFEAVVASFKPGPLPASK